MLRVPIPELMSAVELAMKLRLSDPFVVPVPILSEPKREVSNAWQFKRWRKRAKICALTGFQGSFQRREAIPGAQVEIGFEKTMERWTYLEILQPQRGQMLPIQHVLQPNLEQWSD